MGFPKKLLADHEKLVFDLRPHWIALVAPVLWTVLFLVVYIVGFQLAEDNVDSDGTRDFLQRSVGVISVAAILYLGIFPVMRWFNTHFVLTSDRLITRSGIVAKHSREIPLERINDVAFNQTVIERFLGAGDLLIESAGERGQSRITNVRKPEGVQLMIYKETEENSNRMARGGLESRREVTIPEQIEALKRLVDQGAITEAEFETKKQELLKRL
jgi:uncharacterized membrane protein YdbT with pleckstrin-like domain